ncbi:MAG: transketolase [Nitrospiria bacterium]
MSSNDKHLDALCINTIRMLAVDAVQKANSGHPGTPMGLAPLAYLLWTRFLKHNPEHPDWPDRDRFILSAGHASMLLYSLLHLTGYDLPLEEIVRFRQWGSKTPGHPEYGHTPGVETTTGPLGQGLANGVGMALTERFLATRFNRPDFNIVNHATYVVAGDGDLMEGVASEAASLAGTLNLGKLICFYDDNRITIEGSTEISFTEDVGKRFEAYGWHVLRVEGSDNDLGPLSEAICRAQDKTDAPSLIIVRTEIGYGSPNRQGTARAHGEPLGIEEVKLSKLNLGWPLEPEFHVPDEAMSHFRGCVEKGRLGERAWRKVWEGYTAKYPDLGKEFLQITQGDCPLGWDKAIQNFKPAGPVATRGASGTILNAIAQEIPALIGGSADLAPSNNTHLKDYGDISGEDFNGRNLHFGVREHAMGGVMNGMALHGGVIPYGGTFLVFSDYMKPSMRLAALMKLKVIYVFTHDSIGLGEDGPTHQPIEQMAGLRAIPNLCLIRPADAMETAVAWRLAINHKEGPVALILTRQKLPILDPDRCASADLVEKGAYILSETRSGAPDIVLIATGSEVHLALGAGQKLEEEGNAVRVVSMPSWELFDQQPESYRSAVIPEEGTPCLAIEAAATQGWHRYVGKWGDVLGLDHFGASAPIATLMKEFGFTVENIVARAHKLMGTA